MLEERHALTLANEQLEAVSEQLETVSEQRLRAQAAIGLVVEALSKDAQARDAQARADGEASRPKGKLQTAFDLLRGDQSPEGGQWPGGYSDAAMDMGLDFGGGNFNARLQSWN